MKDYDKLMVLEVLRRVEHIRNTAAAAREVGVHVSTMRRWRNPKKAISTPLRGDVLDAVKAYLDLAGVDAATFRARVDAFPPWERPTLIGGDAAAAAIDVSGEGPEDGGGTEGLGGEE